MSENVNTEAVTTEADTVTPVAPVEGAAGGTDGQGVTSGTDTVDRAAYDALRAELDTFKRDVVAITGRYAEAHNLCSVTDRALAELGLRRVQTGHRVTVTLAVSWDVLTSQVRDFPGIVTDYVIIRRDSAGVDHVWGRYGDEYSRG